jgi:hypothetical protein
MPMPFMMNKIIYSVQIIIWNLKGDPLPLHYTSTLTDNNNEYGENVGKKVTGKQITDKKSWIKSHRKKRHKKKVTGKKGT